MGQNRYWNWEDDDSTFRMNQRDLAIIPEGRYKGFDLSGGTAAWVLELDHETTGHPYNIKMDLSVTPKLGIWKTRQGMLIEEDAPISFNITPIPVLAAGGRYDLIIGEHNYQQVTGGTTAIYKVIEGVASVNPVIPSVTVPKTQVILGYIFIPYTAVDLTSLGVIWTQSEVPIFANDPNIVYIANDQTITGQKTMKIMKMIGAAATVDVVNEKIVITSPSNYYYIEEDDAALVHTIRSIEYQGTRPTFGWDFQIHTAQRLKLVDDGANIAGVIKLQAEGSLDVQVNDVLEFSDYQGHSGTPFAGLTSPFFLKRGGQVNTFGLNKMRGMSAMSFKTGYAAYDAVAKTVDIQANFIDIAPANPDEIRYMKNPFSDHSAGSVGMKVITRINIAFGMTIVNNAVAAAPAGYEKVFTPDGADFTAPNGSLLTWLLLEDGWHLIDVFTNFYSITNMVTTFAALSDTAIGATPVDRSVALYRSATQKWTDYSFKTSIEETQLERKRRETGYTRAVEGTSLVSTAGDTVSAAYKGLELNTTGGDPSQANFIDLEFNVTPADKLACLPAEYPVNTIVCIRFTGLAGFTIVMNTAVIGVTWLPIRTSNPYFNAEDRNYTPPVGKSIFFKRNEDHWELVSDDLSVQRMPVDGMQKTAPTLHANVSPLNAVPLNAYRDQNGFVGFIHAQLVSQLVAPTTWSGVLFTLPADFRPETYLGDTSPNRFFTIPISNTADGTLRLGVILINGSTGAVSLLSHTAGSVNDLKEGDVIDLGGIRFESEEIQ